MVENNGDDDNQCGCALANGKLEKLVEQWELFRNDNYQYYAKGAVAIKQVDEMHSSLSSIKENTDSLKSLGSIAGTNQSIADNFEALCKKFGVMEDTTLSIALGKKQVPLSVVLILLGVFAVAFILKFIEDRTISITPTSIEIEHPSSNSNLKKNSE